MGGGGGWEGEGGEGGRLCRVCLAKDGPLILTTPRTFPDWIHSSTANRSRGLSLESESRTIHRSTVLSSATRKRQNIPAIPPLMLLMGTISAPFALSSATLRGVSGQSQGWVSTQAEYIT